MLTVFRWIFRLSRLILFLISLTFLLFFAAVFFIGIGWWYDFQQDDNPKIWGIHWSDKQAAALNLKPQALEELLEELPFQRLQLMSYWDMFESQVSIYDFKTLDQQLLIAKNREIEVSLQLGIHQSRWPFCHQPNWTKNLNKNDLKDKLKLYLKTIIEYLKDQEHIVEYQLEPEIFKAQKDNCPQKLSKEDLKEIFVYTKTLTQKPIVLSRLNKSVIFKQQEPIPDIFGLEVDELIFNTNWLKRSILKISPKNHYNFLAGNTKIYHLQSKIFIRNVLAEPKKLSENILKSNDFNLSKTSFTALNLDEQLNYAKKIDLKTLDLKGAEWWWWHHEQGDSSFLKIILNFLKDEDENSKIKADEKIQDYYQPSR